MPRGKYERTAAHRRKKRELMDQHKVGTYARSEFHRELSRGVMLRVKPWTRRRAHRSKIFNELKLLQASIKFRPRVSIPVGMSRRERIEAKLRAYKRTPAVLFRDVLTRLPEEAFKRWVDADGLYSLMFDLPGRRRTSAASFYRLLHHLEDCGVIEWRRGGPRVGKGRIRFLKPPPRRFVENESCD
ncbi:MAG: hypothetical protein ACE5PO_02620 [Candidatus Bathyarchaeia archaeon]